MADTQTQNAFGGPGQVWKRIDKAWLASGVILLALLVLSVSIKIGFELLLEPADLFSLTVLNLP